MSLKIEKRDSCDINVDGLQKIMTEIPIKLQKLHYRPASEGSGRSPKICNSSVDESVYIKMIRQERPLWDKKHRDYKNLEVKNKIWKEIAEKCGSTGK